MEKQESTFIGKGKKNEKGKITLSIKMAEADKCISTYKEQRYLRIHVVEMKQPDQYGNTHTAYSFPPSEETPEAQD